MALGNLLVSIRASADEWSADIKQIERETNQLTKAFKPLQEAAQKTGEVFAAAGAGILAALGGMAKAAADYGDALRDTSIRTGVATETLAGYKLAAEQSGTSFESLQGALKKFAVNATAAADGSKEQVKLFKDLGIQVTDTAGHMRPMSDLVSEFSDKFSQLPDGLDRTNTAVKALGRSGSDLTEFFALGSAGLAEFQQQAEKMGLAVGSDFTKQADAFNDNLNSIKQAALGLSVTVGNVLLPALNDLAVGITNAIVTFKDFVKAHEGLVNAATGLGAILGTSGVLLLGLAAVLDIIPKITKALGVLQVALNANPWLLAAGAVVGFVTALLLFPEKVEGVILRAFQTLTNALADFVDAMYRVATHLPFGIMADQLNRDANSLRSFANNLGDMAQQFENASQPILDNTDLIKKFTEAHKKAAAPIHQNEEALKAAAAAAKAEAAAIANLVNEFIPTEAEVRQFNTAIKEVLDKGVPLATVMDKWGKKAGELATKLGMLNREVPEFVSKLSAIPGTLPVPEIPTVAFDPEQILQLEEMRRQSRDFQNMVYDDAKAVTTATEKAAHDANKELERGREIDKKNAKEYQDEIKKQYKETFDSVKHTASLVFHDIFENGLFQFSKLADTIKGIFKTLATEILSTITAQLLTPLVQSITKTLSGVLGKIPGLGGVFGPAAGTAAGGAAGAGAGGAAGGITGAQLAGFATNPFTIAIAAAGVAAIAWVKSQAHHEASTFVKEFQDPFGKLLSSIVDPFNAAAAAGQLTKKAASDALANVHELWDQFTQQANQFATQGSDAALVVKQAFATLTPLLDQIFGDMGNTIAGLTADTEDLAAGVGQIDAATQALLDSARRTQEYVEQVTLAAAGATNLADALGQLEAMGEPTALIIDRLGTDIENFFDILTKAGQPIPDLIQKYHDLMKAGEDAVAAAVAPLQVGGPFSQITPDSAAEIRQFLSALQNQAFTTPTRIVMEMDGRAVASVLVPHNLALARNQSVRIVGTR
jgi:TP901 family phage tail tape measure protein